MRAVKKLWIEAKGFVFFALAMALVQAVSNAWGEDRPVGAFFEEFVALCFWLIVCVGPLIVGGVSGGEVYDRYESMPLAVFVGLVAAALIAAAGWFLVESVPGVNWRFDRIISSGSEDY